MPICPDCQEEAYRAFRAAGRRPGHALSHARAYASLDDARQRGLACVDSNAVLLRVGNDWREMPRMADIVNEFHQGQQKLTKSQRKRI